MLKWTRDFTGLGYHVGMRRHLLPSVCRFKKKITLSFMPGGIASMIRKDETLPALKVVGWTSAAVGVAALGLFVGRELRARYKFKRRTPSDFFSHAGDEVVTEYGMGI